MKIALNTPRWGAALAIAGIAAGSLSLGAVGAQAAVAAAVQPGAVASPAHAQAVTVYSLPYTDHLTRVVDGELKYVEFAEWAAWGYPAPQPAPTQYLRYSWSPIVTAKSTFPGAQTAVYEVLSPQEQLRAGNPSAAVVAWIPTTIIAKYSTSDELFAVLDTYDDPRNADHKLTFAEWRAMGYPKVANNLGGVYSLPWTDSLFYFDQGDETMLSFDQWRAMGYPTPKRMQHLSGEMWHINAKGEIFYRVSTGEFTKHVTFAEWARAGYPKPERI